MDLPRPSTVVYYGGLGTSTAAISKPVTSQSIAMPHVDGKIASDPVSLTRVIVQIREQLRLGVGLAASNPLAGCITFRDVEMTSGVQVILPHGLGSPARFEAFNVRPAVTSTVADLATISIVAPNPQPVAVHSNTQIALVPTFASAGAVALVDVRLTT